MPSSKCTRIKSKNLLTTSCTTTCTLLEIFPLIFNHITRQKNNNNNFDTIKQNNPS